MHRNAISISQSAVEQINFDQLVCTMFKCKLKNTKSSIVHNENVISYRGAREYFQFSIACTSILIAVRICLSYEENDSLEPSLTSDLH